MEVVQQVSEKLNPPLGRGNRLTNGVPFIAEKAILASQTWVQSRTFTNWLAERGSESRAEDLISRRGSTLLAWRQFGFVKMDLKQEKVRIVEPVAAKDSSTTNLFNHLCVQHSKEYADEKSTAPETNPKPPPQKLVQTTLAASFGRRMQYDKGSHRRQDITTTLSPTTLQQT